MRETLQQQKEHMLKYHLKGRGIKDKRVLRAFSEVPREKFVRGDLQRMAYADSPLPIGHKVTISQPYIVALMCELLEVKEDYKVLDIGSGSGYQSAILAQLSKKVVALERVKPLVEQSKRVFRELEYENIEVIHTDGSKGYEEYAPYDAINIAAATEDINNELLRQLKIGGKIVYPQKDGERYQRLTVIEKKDGGYEKTYHGGVHFVPLIRD